MHWPGVVFLARSSGCCGYRKCTSQRGELTSLNFLHISQSHTSIWQECQSYLCRRNLEIRLRALELGISKSWSNIHLKSVQFPNSRDKSSVPFANPFQLQFLFSWLQGRELQKYKKRIFSESMKTSLCFRSFPCWELALKYRDERGLFYYYLLHVVWQVRLFSGYCSFLCFICTSF